MHATRHAALLLALAAGAAACGQDGPRGDPLRGGEAPRTQPPSPHGGGMPAGHPPLPGGVPPVPAGHPPMDGPAVQAGPLGGAPAAPASGPLAWTVPAGWKESPPANAMRVAQFDLPAGADGASVQCVVFGGIGGGKQKNIDRWIGQFVQPDGSPSAARAKTAESASGDVKITRVSLLGTFTAQMVPGKSDAANTPDSMLLGAIVETPAGEFQVKLVGPAALLGREEANFDAFLSSIRVK